MGRELCEPLHSSIKRVEEMLSQGKQETGIFAEITCKSIPGTHGQVSQTAAQKDSSKSGRSSQPASTQNPTSAFFFSPFTVCNPH